MTITFYTFFSPIRLTSIAHAFNYRIAVLQDGAKLPARVSEGWARVKNVYQCCNFAVIFWGGTLGEGGGVLLILYMYM